MKTIRFHEEINSFLKKVCSHIQAKEVHKEVRMELESHLQDLIEDKLNKGIEQETAIREAISQMGAPELLGEQFHHVHRPHFDWKLLVLITVFMLFGLFAVYAAQASLSDRLGLGSIGLRQLVYVCVGVGLMLYLSFANYLKFAKYSWILYIGTIVMLLYTLTVGGMISGVKGYIRFSTTGINIVALAPYLLLLSLAGIWSIPQPSMKGETLNKKRARSIWTNIGTVWFPSALLLSAPSFVDFVLLFIGCMVMLLVLRKSRVILYTHFGLLFSSMIFVILKESFHSYRFARLMSFIKPDDNFNYIIIQSKKAIASAGWWGHGFGSPLQNVPEIHSEMMFTFLIYCFGWAAGIFILMMVILFILHALHISFKVKDHYGKALVSGLLTLFAIQYMWNMLMSFGWAPFNAFSLPFVSFKGVLVIFQFAAIGLILSVYRRKDLILGPINQK